MKKNNIFKIVFITLFLLFISLYIANNNGYIDNNYRNKMTMTEEQIKQFEKDIKNNKNIDINKYVIDKEEKYDNSLSKLALKLSKTISNCFQSTINYIFGSFQSGKKE